MHLTPQILNELFQPLTPEQRIRTLYEYFSETDILVTSSFGIHSALLLHLVHLQRPTQPVHFINTHFHFPETLAYKAELGELLDLHIEEVGASPEIRELTSKSRMWERHPDACCHLNKVLPLKQVQTGYKIWVSGLMAFQTPYRNGLQIIEESHPGETIWRFHPLLDLDEARYETYRAEYGWPVHPLEKLGYGSVGCRNCTARNAGRNGRWKDHGKTECGLHLRGK